MTEIKRWLDTASPEIRAAIMDLDQEVDDPAAHEIKAVAARLGMSSGVALAALASSTSVAQASAGVGVTSASGASANASLVTALGGVKTVAFVGALVLSAGGYGVFELAKEESILPANAASPTHVEKRGSLSVSQKSQVPAIEPTRQERELEQKDVKALTSARRAKAPTSQVAVVSRNIQVGVKGTPTTSPHVEKLRTSETAAEAKLLLAARRALSKEPGIALKYTNDHRRRYPRGVFSEERERVAIEALVRIGRIEEAKKRTYRFAQRWPNSLYLSRIRHLIKKNAQ